MWSRPIVSNAVTLDVNATYLTATGTRVPALVSLGFDPLDPVAITVRAPVGDPGLAMLAFARDLFLAADAGLADDADRPLRPHQPGQPAGTGDADVAWAGEARVEPVVRGGRRLLAVSVPRAGGRAVLEMSATRVTEFVRRTYTLVSREAEDVMLDLDLELALGLAALD